MKSVFHATKEEEEAWCVQGWVEWRQKQAGDVLAALDSPPPGPDRRFRAPNGSIIGVEVTRIMNPQERAGQSTAEKFLAEEVFPLIRPDSLPGRLAVTVARLPWRIPFSQRRVLAGDLAQQIEGKSQNLEVGKQAQCEASKGGVEFGIFRLSDPNPGIDLGLMEDGGGWVSDIDEVCSGLVRKAIAKKAERGQLRQADIAHRVLLLHDRVPGVSEDAFKAGISSTDHRYLREFDEIFLIDTYNEGRCLRGWPTL